MRFHHMCLVTTDLKASIHLWRDVMGFDLRVESEIPDGLEAGPNTMATPELLESLYKVKGARSKLGVLVSKDGAVIELLETLVPAVQKTPPENLRYAHSGIRELGLATENIDAFFLKVKAAGYETQTDHVWDSSGMGRTFIFYDHDGNMIQIWEDAAGAPALLSAAH